ncbi:MAG: riboflavin synthase [Veillonella sp.]|jgi:riboflavin synthase, alpha subunit|nr:riboflavin synthase [Veillonella sp.]
MFTGIIEEIGFIKGIRKGPKSIALTIGGDWIFSDLAIGDSVSVNGVCLTATSIKDHSFTADVMPETMKQTNFGHLQVGDPVNLERAMAANGRFGGHMVAGHVDGKGQVCGIEKNDNAIIFTFKAPKAIMDYVIYKGSIAIDGISLTVMRRTDSTFSVSIIPHTLGETILAYAKMGTQVNLESDIAGRYIRHFMKLGAEENKQSKDKQVTKDMSTLLVENGFM